MVDISEWLGVRRASAERSAVPMATRSGLDYDSVGPTVDFTDRQIAWLFGVLAWILIGLIAGYLAAKITNAPRGIVRNLIVGLVGSLFGGFLFSKLGLHVMSDFWGELITATIGAVVFLALWQAIRRA